MASGPQTDFNFMDISVAPYDLSDRGVAGRTAPGLVDAFLYTERGIYRPGETVHLAALLRNERGQALDPSILRPQGQASRNRWLSGRGNSTATARSRYRQSTVRPHEAW